MHVFLDINTGASILKDPEGEECANAAEAMASAWTSARELMSHALIDGRLLPLRWKIEIRGVDGAVQGVVEFAEVAGVGALA